MAERITTARPYAKAIFALARKGNSLGPTSTGLQRAATVVADPAVRGLLTSPHVTPAQLAGLVNDIAGLDSTRTAATSCRCSRRTADSDSSPRSRRCSSR